MSNAKHTPGPWEWEEDDTGSMFLVSRSSIYGVLAVFVRGRDDYGILVSPFDAQLIAAAPELLEALDPFAQFACSPPGECQCHNCRARDIVAKAKGDSNEQC